MRARLVRPEFWADSLIGKLPDSVRLFYIGLWCVADDAGFIEWDPARIAADLMPYRGITAREKRVAELAEPLIRLGRIDVLDCARHALIPTLERHRIAGGNTSERVRDDHMAEVSRPRVAASRESSMTNKNRQKPDLAREVHSTIDGNPSRRSPRGHESIKKRASGAESVRVRTRPDVGSSGAPRSAGLATDASDTKVRTGTDKSRSESLSPSLSESHSRSPRRQRNGSTDPESERSEAIARAQSKLDDPTASPDVKQAARFALKQLGVGA